MRQASGAERENFRTPTELSLQARKWDDPVLEKGGACFASTFFSSIIDGRGLVACLSSLSFNQLSNGVAWQKMLVTPLDVAFSIFCQQIT